MSDHDPAVTLRQILELCDKGIELRASIIREEFRADWRKQMLGERLVEVLGEAVKRLPDDLRARHPEAFGGRIYFNRLRAQLGARVLGGR